MINMWYLLLLALWTGCLGQNFISETREDLFSATSQLEELVSRETDIVNVLENYINKAQDQIHSMKQYVNAFRSFEADGFSSGKNEIMTTHPVDAYLILKRLTIEWANLEQVITRHVNITQEMIQGVEYLRESTAFPEIEDLHGAAVALVRLQDVYRLNMTTFPLGYVNGIGTETQEFRSHHQMTARDCLFVGKHAFNQGYYDKAIEWFETALHHSQDLNDHSTSPEEINPFLETAIKVHDDILEKRGPRGSDWQTNPIPMNKGLAKKTKYQFIKNSFEPKLFQHQSDQEEEEHYTRLCRGEQMRPAEADVKLRCHYERKGSKYHLINPLLVEELSLDPYIVIIHQFLSSNEADQIIAKAKPKLFTSRHRSPEGGYVASMVRTSKNAWLQETGKASDRLTQYTKRIEAATNLLALPATAGEEYQVANYGIGGLYVPHTDYLFFDATNPVEPDSFEHFIGDRLSTFMIYLSDVDAGGATVFPRIGVSVWPKKGSAVFWYNLYRSGAGDEFTKHGACPVLHGSKWICNKWIHYNDQIHTHKCGLNTWDKFDQLHHV